MQQRSIIEEKLVGVVERVTYHNPDNGWSVLRVQPFAGHGEVETVTVHQLQVFAGATMEFRGAWTDHPRFGRQFTAVRAVERKPATAGALEKYLGSGLIKGVGPKTATKIVRHFGADTLEVFERDIDRLVEVQGIAQRKLASISLAWREHRAIRDVMMFLQEHGVSTLFAVRIYKQYGDAAIALVRENPYRLAKDFYGIGFFSADRIALSMGLARDGDVRVDAAIRHVLSASREQGHCYLGRGQINARVGELLDLDVNARLDERLAAMEADGSLRVRHLPDPAGSAPTQACYYSRSLYYDEDYLARRLLAMIGRLEADSAWIDAWLARHARSTGIILSDEQAGAVCAMASLRFALLTGGPGCGKTTTLRTLVSLLRAMGRAVTLAAPTGRAAQRMSEVVGLEARTIHRLLEYQPSGFKRDEANPLALDVLVVDECSMLDVSLAAALLRAVPPAAALLFIGDPDQLPAVGAGNVLGDLIASGVMPCFRLTQVFRQAAASRIISHAHEINQGRLPAMTSPFKDPEVWRREDCFFIDTEETTQAQLRFVERVRRHFDSIDKREEAGEGRDLFGRDDPAVDYRDEGFELPERFAHVEIGALLAADSQADELRALLRRVHPWSSLYYGLTASEVVRKLHVEWIPKYFGKVEIQVLCPMIRGSLGAAALNKALQESVNPAGPGRREIMVGERLFRQGDRVIHRRNNYDLEVFNGDIGTIHAVDNEALTCQVAFPPEGRLVEYQREQLAELDLAYAITVHKSQGSEFDVVILPVLSQHYRMLFRNLLYTGLTRAKKLCVMVGSRRALAMAVANQDTSRRQTALQYLLSGKSLS